MKSFSLRSSGLIVLLALLALGTGMAEAATKGATVEGITEYRLDNGLQVLLYPDASKPTVTVNLTILVGSRHEGYGETGMAHLLEHMVFKGTPSHPQIPKVLQERGAKFNGTTWVDRTNYFETLPATDDNLEFALRLEADRMVNSYVKREDLLSEMTVVRNEFERGENTPAYLLHQRIMAVAFDWHNYGKSTIGNRTDIERVPIERLQAFYKKYYQPDNAVLVVAGRFDEAKALEYINKYFGSIPKPTRKLETTYTEEPPQDGERFVTMRRVGEVGIVGAAYHVPAGPHPDVAALDVLGNILAMPPSGRLYKALVETGKATGTDADVSSWHDAGVFTVEAEVRRDGSLEEARDLLLEVTEKVATEGVTEEEVNRARQRILKQRELAAADTSGIAVQLSNWASQGDWRLYFLHRDRIEKVTPSDVQAAAERYLKSSNRTVGMFIPTDKPERAEIPATPDLAKLFDGYTGREAVAMGEVFDVSPANIESRATRSSLSEGIKTVLLPKKTRGETVRVQVVLRYGRADSLKGHESAADFLPPLMLRGTKNLSRQQIQDELDKNSATLNASGGVGTATFTIETKRANLPAVLQLLQQVLREPTFPQEEFEVLRRQQLAGLEEQLNDPQGLAVRHVRRTVAPYAKDDVRYTPTVQEEIERVQALTLDQIKTLYTAYLGSRAGEIAVVGDFDPQETTAALQKIFSGWSSHQAYARIPLVIFPDVKGGKHQILTPDKANAVYVGGLAFAMKDSDPDYPAVLLGNYVFGAGALSSRLGDRVRQKEGLSYGIGSMLSTSSLDPRTSMTIFAIANPANMTKVEAAIQEELQRLLKDGIPEEELARAKRGFLQQQQVARANDGSLTNLLADTAYVGRTMEYYADLEKKIEALTPEQVVAALRKHINPGQLAVVTAGDFGATAKADGAAAPKAAAPKR